MVSALHGYMGTWAWDAEFVTTRARCPLVLPLHISDNLQLSPIGFFLIIRPTHIIHTPSLLFPFYLLHPPFALFQPRLFYLHCWFPLCSWGFSHIQLTVFTHPGEPLSAITFFGPAVVSSTDRIPNPAALSQVNSSQRHCCSIYYRLIVLGIYESFLKCFIG